MKRLTILLSVFALTQLLFIGFYDYVGWDEAAYIMTGRYYWGEKVYYEVLRPPLYPLFLGFMEKILLMQAVPPLFALLLSLSVYSVGKKFFDKKTGLFAGILVYFAPLVVNWSPKFMTAIPASAFLMLAVSSQDRKKVLLPAIFFTAACLIRYPFGAFLPAILLLFRDWKKAGSFLTLVTVLSAPWLLYNFLEFGNPLHSMTAQWEYTSANQDVNPVFYLLSIPESFGFILLPLFLVRKKDLKKLLPLFLFILFYSFFLAGFNHKESRFLIPLIPFVCLASARVLSQKKFGAQAVLFLVLASSIFFLALSPLPSANHETVLELADFFSDKQGVVITPYWPLVAYHANLTVHGPTTPIYREYWIDEWNVSWVVSEESLKTSFLKERKVIYGKSDTLYVYEVIQ